MKIFSIFVLAFNVFLKFMGGLFLCLLLWEYLTGQEAPEYRSIVHEYRNEELGGATAPEYTPRGPPGVVNGPYINPRPPVKCNHRQYPERKKCRGSDSYI